MRSGLVWAAWRRLTVPARLDGIGAGATVLAVFFGLGPAASAQAQEVDDRPGVAVLPFEVSQMVPPADLSDSGMNFGLQEMLTYEFAVAPEIRVVDRREISAVMRELDLHGSGDVAAETAARIGEIVGARYMVKGAYTSLSGEVRIFLRVISVETSEVESDHVVRVGPGTADDIYTLLVEAAARLLDGLDLPPLDIEARPARFSPPRDAFRQYSSALMSAELGRNDEAVETLTRLVDEWPEYEAAREELEELTSPRG